MIVINVIPITSSYIIIHIDLIWLSMTSIVV